ncbi:LuxR C-terminal-related transcriptional regulator [Leifsonia xyli]|uniref:LuxR C-terminal-related transcriptional regulator n=1 Tax=Leifsonia xyli TaxID=1575 RepID=UPI0009DBF42D|nr:LuxR C-terminal-related transcriptional regulator [Leifsonia xyli]
MTRLTPPRPPRREREIRRLVRAGLSNREIALRLTLSVRTVEGHVQNTLVQTRLRVAEAPHSQRVAPPDGVTKGHPAVAVHACDSRCTRTRLGMSGTARFHPVDRAFRPHCAEQSRGLCGQALRRNPVSLSVYLSVYLDRAIACHRHGRTPVLHKGKPP